MNISQMKKISKFIGLAWLAFAWTAATQAATVTNVLRNISLQLTLYEEASTNAQGTKVLSKSVAYSTKNLIAALQSVTGQPFGNNAKLVESTLYAAVTNASSNNIPLVASNTGACLSFGAGPVCIGDSAVVLDGNTFVSGGPVGNVSTNVASDALNSSASATFNTNAGYQTTFTPQTNGSGVVTNFTVVSLIPGTGGTSSIDILYGTSNALYPISNYFVFSTNSQEIFMESGTALTSGSPHLASESSYSISNLAINYFVQSGPTNLGLTLNALVKQSLKVDVLAAHGTNRVVADIFGATATWNVIGSGYMGGSFSSNGPGVIVSDPADSVSGYLSDTVPVVVQGTINVSFLKNLAQ